MRYPQLEVNGSLNPDLLIYKTLSEKVLALHLAGITNVGQMVEILGVSQRRVRRAYRNLRKRGFKSAGRGRGERKDAKRVSLRVPMDLLSFYRDKQVSYPELYAVLANSVDFPGQDRLARGLPGSEATPTSLSEITAAPEVRIIAGKPRFNESLRIERLSFEVGFPSPEAWFSPLVDVRTGEACVQREIPVEPSPVEEVRRLQDLLNSQDLDLSVFVERARELGSLVDFHRANRYQVRFELHSLAQFFREPRQVYKAVPRTLRLYCVGGGLQTMKSSHREALLSGCTQVDLKHFQAALQAKVLGIQSFDAYISAGFWLRLQEETGARKDALKTALYSLMYGSSVYSARELATSDGGMSVDQWESFLDSELMQELCSKSFTNMTAIRGATEILDAYGRNLIPLLAQRPKGRNAGQYMLSSARSIAAAQAQSYELKVLAPLVIHLLEKKVPVIAWLHDGFIIPPDHDPAVLEEALEIGRKLLGELEINSSFEITTLGKTE